MNCNMATVISTGLTVPESSLLLMYGIVLGNLDLQLVEQKLGER